MSTTRGVLYVHSAPSALCPHVEWAVGGVFGTPTRLPWTPQPVERAAYRAERAWTGPVGSAERLASVLRGWQRLRFEVTEDPTPVSEGRRYSYTPALGVFHAVTGPHGDVQVPEDRLRAALARAGRGRADLAAEVRALLGGPWDDELEPFRCGAEAAPAGGAVRRLHQVV